MTINLLDAATYFKGLDHQVKAFRWLNTILTEEQKEEFARIYRNSGTVKKEIESKPVTNTWNEVLNYARKAGAKFPEVVAAQWALESGYGKHTSGANNYFGLKGKGASVGTKEFINGKWIDIKDSFINFDGIESCIQYLVDRWYKDYKNYKGINRAKTIAEAVKLLETEGYATDPGYANKLINIINRHANNKGEEKQVKKPNPYGNPLQVPWYAQMDSSTDQGARMCFSSSCAMLVQYLKPGSLQGPNGDDQYLKRVQQYGDTTEITAQLRTLSGYGIRATLSKTATIATLKSQIDKGIPVPCGYIHKGPLSKPSGGGHWLIVVGYTSKELVVHDPFGTMNLRTGERSSSVARFAKYDMNDFVLRWSVEPIGPGAYRHVPNRGWIILAQR